MANLHQAKEMFINCNCSYACLKREGLLDTYKQFGIDDAQEEEWRKAFTEACLSQLSTDIQHAIQQLVDAEAITAIPELVTRVMRANASDGYEKFWYAHGIWELGGSMYVHPDLRQEYHNTAVRIWRALSGGPITITDAHVEQIKPLLDGNATPKDYLRNLARRRLEAAPIERAKQIFVGCGGSSFHMTREGLREEYQQYAVSPAQKEAWRKEIISSRIGQLSNNVVSGLTTIGAVEVIPLLLERIDHEDSYNQLFYANGLFELANLYKASSEQREKAIATAIRIWTSLVDGPITISEVHRQQISQTLQAITWASDPEEYVRNYAKSKLAEVPRSIELSERARQRIHTQKQSPGCRSVMNAVLRKLFIY